MSKKLVTLIAAAGLLGCAPAAQQRADGVDVRPTSFAVQLVPAKDIEEAATQEYAKVLADARSKNALAPDNHPQVQRLRRIAQRLIPQAQSWNTSAQSWRWEVNLIGGKQVNAFCMPGGKIVFYSGLIDQLQLSDDEIAVVMGHEMTHALREHAREQMGKATLTSWGLDLASRLTGASQFGQAALGIGAKLLTLTFSRNDESEADAIGLELMARAGFNPRAGVTLWQKMGAQNKAAPPQWLSTHPAGKARIADIEANLPKVIPLYEKARKG